VHLKFVRFNLYSWNISILSGTRIHSLSLNCRIQHQNYGECPRDSCTREGPVRLRENGHKSDHCCEDAGAYSLPGRIKNDKSVKVIIIAEEMEGKGSVLFEIGV
jgi:hypothetical protein